MTLRPAAALACALLAVCVLSCVLWDGCAQGSTLEARLSLDPTFDLKKASVAVPPAFCAAMPGPAIAGVRACIHLRRGLQGAAGTT